MPNGQHRQIERDEGDGWADYFRVKKEKKVLKEENEVLKKANSELFDEIEMLRLAVDNDKLQLVERIEHHRMEAAINKEKADLWYFNYLELERKVNSFIMDVKGDK